MSQRNKYSEKTIHEAIEAIHNGMPAAQAARRFNIPRMTLVDKLKGRTAILSKIGAPTILSAIEETHLKNWILHLAANGFPVTKSHLKDSVALLMKKMKRPNPFINDRPGRHWYEGFMKRHPEICARVSQGFTKSRAAVSKQNITQWFAELQDYFKSAKLEEVLEDSNRIYNCDESGFLLSPKEDKVLVKKGVKSVHHITSAGDKESLTVLLTVNAMGQIAPPMVVFKLKTMQYPIAKSAPKDWGLGLSNNGWMTGETFYEYVANVFYPWLLRQNIKFPIIMYLDGHSSHHTLPLSNFCREKNIILIALFPNSTHLLQPLDVAVFRPLKSIWRKAVHEWRTRNGHRKMRKEDFCPLFGSTINQLPPSAIVNGFKKTGLFPFNVNNVGFDKIIEHQNLPEITKNKISKIEQHPVFLESQLSMETLQSFRNNKGSEWQGKIEDSSLYYFWRSLNRKQTEINQVNSDSSSDSSDLASDENNNLTEISQISGLTDLIFPIDKSLLEISDLNLDNLHTVASDITPAKIEFFSVQNGELIRLDVENETNRNTVSENKPLPSTSKDSILQYKDTTTTLKATTISPHKPKDTLLAQNILPLLDITPPSVLQTISKENRISATSTTSLNSLNNNKKIQIISDIQIVPPNSSGSTIPTPFKETLFWPTQTDNTKAKVKIPSVITSDRWTLFHEKKKAEKEDKEREKAETKRKRIEKKSCTKSRNNKIKKENESWFCNICETREETDMIQCLTCKIWYHTKCVKVRVTTKIYYCPDCKNI